jgi:hypothetical protein
MASGEQNAKALLQRQFEEDILVFTEIKIL